MNPGKHNLTKTRRVKGRIFTLDRSSRLKGPANKRAETLRKQGFTARIVKMGGMHRVFKGPRSMGQAGVG